MSPPSAFARRIFSINAPEELLYKDPAKTRTRDIDPMARLLTAYLRTVVRCLAMDSLLRQQHMLQGEAEIVCASCQKANISKKETWQIIGQRPTQKLSQEQCED